MVPAHLETVAVRQDLSVFVGDHQFHRIWSSERIGALWAYVVPGYISAIVFTRVVSWYFGYVQSDSALKQSVASIQNNDDNYSHYSLFIAGREESGET